MILSSETTSVLQSFLNGGLTLPDFYAWVTSVEDDTFLFESERDALSRLRLLIIECDEEMRSVDEVRNAAAALLLDSLPADRVASSNRTLETISSSLLAPA